MSPNVQLSQQSPQSQFMQLQQSLPQVQLQVQLSQQLPYQYTTTIITTTITIQQSLQAQLMQLPQIRLPQQSLPLLQIQQSPQMQLLQQLLPSSQVQQLQPLLQGHPQLILSLFLLQQSFLPSLLMPQYNWAFEAQLFQLH
ncbi:6524_t:CDS:2 [Dentiscutata erythropus]|uniref:6524_t:CDS:1 n=1 Tax=Dentiscutata erythropus TaxID=1348616 RepID=A0A9N9J5W2_9GLOM|nr:6524_t:CDS:2 [Dentiscutata erythropus]